MQQHGHKGCTSPAFQTLPAPNAILLRRIMDYYSACDTMRQVNSVDGYKKWINGYLEVAVFIMQKNNIVDFIPLDTLTHMLGRILLHCLMFTKQR